MSRKREEFTRGGVAASKPDEFSGPQGRENLEVTRMHFDIFSVFPLGTAVWVWATIDRLNENTLLRFQLVAAY